VCLFVCCKCVCTVRELLVSISKVCAANLTRARGLMHEKKINQIQEKSNPRRKESRQSDIESVVVAEWSGLVNRNKIAIKAARIAI
jgi:uncharacterized membrane protein